MRVLDDKIVYSLNTSIPTESFKTKIDASSACQDLYEQIQKGHSERENVIKNCIMMTAETVKQLKSAKDSKPDDMDINKNLKYEQKKVSSTFILGYFRLNFSYHLFWFVLVAVVADGIKCRRSNQRKDY